ncbi:MAG: hypothetical protein A2X05_10625 [Bacteroidetes bacterium GWE2_41_25]|nr:MAG: hypothetical protein A2X03_17880 [Bacteroidetes bacterium GWA2_40_15]OFX82594.1 MAG: hypothetical protein A2X06_07855 [Bacteroidetes bacterium GWC2_40_22]OFY07556.1 MAG: hypothetical protein A2X05_10625 [Bacteroidetes bacterium GWE2_41_25]OFY62070.1 MAG: hypothetical protein A2X04_14890 [Bacteroidetes bacterium GWF2_41_9]HBH84988.1 hypothetical protein [Bacteroidales bacterium]
MKYLILLLFILCGSIINGQVISVKSPDNNIVININTSEKLCYSITFNNRTIAGNSRLGFEFKDEEPME